jgi:hypothetical protein
LLSQVNNYISEKIMEQKIFITENRGGLWSFRNYMRHTLALLVFLGNLLVLQNRETESMFRAAGITRICAIGYQRGPLCDVEVTKSKQGFTTMS